MQKTVIDNQYHLGVNLQELYVHRELIWMLAYRDLKIKYAHTFLGVLWAVISPIIVMLIMTIVFSTIIRIDTKDVPYPLFLLAGMTAWSFFSLVVDRATAAIFEAEAIIQKVYFPRLVILLSKLLVYLIDLGISLLFVFVLMGWYSIMPVVHILYLPIFILLTILVSFTVAVWTSALSVRFRDLQQVFSLGIYLFFFLTPVFYPIDYIPADWQGLYSINPMLGIVEGYRWCLWGGDFPHFYAMVAMVFTISTLPLALAFFGKTEKMMADVL